MRYCGLYDQVAIGRITLNQYRNMMQASRLQNLDEVYKIHLQAWTNQQAKATKEVGAGKNKRIVPIYKKFEEFFDYEALLSEVTGETYKKAETPEMTDFLSRIAKANQ